MANTTIGGITLDDGSTAIIKENTCRKESSLVILPLYLSDSDGTDVFDYGGVVKTITMDGIFIADTVAELKTWIDSLEALQQGHQDTGAGYPLEFVDDLRGTIDCKIIDFNTTKSEGAVTKVTWSLKIVQSSTNA